MLEILVVAISFVLLACGVEFATVDAAADGKSIPPIYWNTSDPIFKDNQNVQYVKMGQRMDIICPLALDLNQDDGAFYFILYKVSREDYLSCSTVGQKKLLTCDKPSDEKKYTFLFQDITPSPWGLTFQENQAYYFISTSDGSKSGIHNKKGGACVSQNMKLKITVTERDDEEGGHRKPVVPDVKRIETSTSIPRYINTVRQIYQDSKKNSINDGGSRQGETGKDDNHTELVNSNGLVIGVVLGACAVLFIVLLGFLGYKVYRKRRHVKKYQSPGISASRTAAPQAQVTLLPISSHQAAQLRVHSSRSSAHHHHLEIQDLQPPPPYNESIMDHAGSTMEV